MSREPDRSKPPLLGFLRTAAVERGEGPQQQPTKDLAPPLAANDNVPIFIYNHIQMEKTMSLDRSVLAFAGIMVLLSVLLTAFVSPLFIWLTVFVGLNLLQSAFTGFCPAAMVFRKLGVKPGCAF
jgi:hypothetical protein